MSEDIKKTQDVETPDTSKKEDSKEEEKLLTQEQFDKALKDRLERDRAKNQKESDAKIKEARAEAERLAKLSAEEQDKELRAKTEKENEERESAISRRENRLEARELFVNSKVPENLVDYVVDTDKDKTMESAETFVKNFNDSVAKTVAEQLKGTPPKDISTNSDKLKERKVVRAF